MPKKVARLLALLLVLTPFALISCNTAGPAFPREDAIEYLKSIGKNEIQISRVVNQSPLSPTEFLEYSHSPEVNVRYLVANNPHLTTQQIDMLMKDKTFFVRSGAAGNENLTRAQMLTLLQDPSHTVYCQLAENSSVPEDLLIRLHQERNPGLVWFAANPNCPERIIEEIRGSGDESARHWLKTMNQWKKEGMYVQGQNGRWYKP